MQSLLTRIGMKSQKEIKEKIEKVAWLLYDREIITIGELSEIIDVPVINIKEEIKKNKLLKEEWKEELKLKSEKALMP